jgi:hypothetical protein
MTAAAHGIQFDRERCASALREEIFATEEVYALVRGGMAFRDAYREVKERGVLGTTTEGATADERNDFLAARTHLGAPGTHQEALIRDRLQEVADRLRPYTEGAAAARDLLDRFVQE